MKKTALILAMIVLLAFPVTAYAASPRSVGIWPGISFDGTTANCTVSVTANSTSEEISITAKLWQGNTCVATWSDSGDGYLFFSASQTVTKGKEYKLTVDVTIDGVTKPTVSISGTC